MALSFLLQSYNVYVYVDQVVCGDPEREVMYFDCVHYCAVHIVSTQNTILELLSREKEEAARAPLEALLSTGTVS